MAACSACGPATARQASPAPALLGPCVSATTHPSRPLGVIATGKIWTVASGLDEPDDLLFSDGRLLIGQLGAGTIQVLTPGGATTTLPVHISSVEGMTSINGKLYAAGQAEDVVDEIEGNQLRTVIRLSPVPGQDGVDGIGAQGGQLVVPDSPRGVIDWVDPGSGRITRQIAGFVRPTGVWATADGSLLVADEYGNAAYRIGLDGSRSVLVRGLPNVDDIAQDSMGFVFVVTPSASGGRLAQLQDGRANDLASQLAAPQGIVVDGADNLYFSEENAGRVDLMIRTFKLVPLTGVQESQTQPVCIDVARASGFGDPVRLDGSAGLEVVQQPGSGTQGAVLVHGCASAPCSLTASSGSRSDRLWISSSP